LTSHSFAEAARCPACGARYEAAPSWTCSATEAAQHFVLFEAYPEQHLRLAAHVRTLWGQDRCAMLPCGACGLRFAWPFVAGDELFYNLAYPHSAYPRERWEFDESLRSLAASGDLQGHVLEIGAGFGHFLEKLSPRWVAPERVVAVEYNEVARRSLASKGFAAVSEDVRGPAFDQWRGKVGAFFMFQVLEHMDDLSGLAERLRELARPKAALFVAVPNSARIEFNERHRSLLDMPPNHITCWTPEALTAFSERSGWALKEFRRQPMTLVSFLRQDIVYSHLRRAQRAGSLANRVRAMQRSSLRSGLEAVTALCAVPLRLTAWRDAVAARGTLGDSVWMRFEFE
jgi:SAM-dependent methyltransferase